MIFRYCICFLLCVSASAMAKLNVVTTTTDIKWLVEKIGGERVVVESLLDGLVDPHFVEAMPHFVGKVARADVFCLVGLGLEIGWVPKILSRSGNKKIQSGGKGHCDVGGGIKAMDIPVGKVDRSLGDVHPEGNPHYHLGPGAFLDGGRVVLGVLMGLDASRADFYNSNFKKLVEELARLKTEVSEILRPLRKKKIMEYHKEFSYFLKEFNLINDGSLEELPGVPPSAGRLARVTINAKKRGVVMLLATAMSPRKTVKKFQESSGVPVAILPLSILSNKKHRDYPQLLKSMATIMVSTYQNGK